MLPFEFPSLRSYGHWDQDCRLSQKVGIKSEDQTSVGGEDG